MSDKPNWTPIRIRLGDLIPWDRNPKFSTKEDAQRLIETEKEFGQPQTFSVSPYIEGSKVNCYDGHQRDSAWRAVYGNDFEVWAMQSDRHLTEAERERFVLRMHNAHGQWRWEDVSGWDVGTLKDGWFDSSTLKGWKADVTALGEFLKSEAPTVDAEPEVDRAAELLEKWQVKTGDMFAIGEHRLICGDCTDSAVIDRLTGGEKADMVFTDPPYGVNFAGKGGASIAGDTTGALIPIVFDLVIKKIVTNKAWFYFCGGSNNMGIYSKLFDYYLHTYPRIIVWDKGQPTIRHESYHSSFEFIYVGYTKGAGSLWFGSRVGEAATDVWHVQRPSNDERVHLTEKPVELPARAIGNSCPENGIVFEPFGGSGSTMVACQNLGRKCRAVEISPAYVAVALERMAMAFPGIDIRRIDG